MDPVAMYLREIDGVQPLGKDEEALLFKRLDASGNWQGDAETAARRLIESYLRLVVAIAERYSSSGIPMLELIQEGNIGLFNAVKSFAANPSGDFSDHASACIESAIKTAIADSK